MFSIDTRNCFADVEYVSPILRVVHSSANKNFPCQGIMVKGTIVEIDGSKFKEWWGSDLIAVYYSIDTNSLSFLSRPVLIKCSVLREVTTAWYLAY